MKRQAVVWKESIYKNSFTCSCGAHLADADGMNFESNVLIERGDFRTYVYCKKCLRPVAFFKFVEIEEDAYGMQGDINEYERRKMN